MSRTIHFLLLVCLCSTSGIAISAQPPEPSEKVGQNQAQAEFELVWSDEFEVDGRPDPANWDYEHGFVRNEELQWYTPANASCDGRLLVIEGRRERVENPRYRPDGRDWRRNRQFAEYTSASATTRGKHEWLYGRFVMRGRIDTRAGLWPAFWTLGSARGWPGCGEIDIMEYYRGTLLANVAWLGPHGQPAWDDFKRPIGEFPDPDWPKKFHVWRMDWDRDFIRLYVDDELLNEVPLDTTVNNDSQRTNPLREPHYIILNLAIGGTQGADPAATEFPAKFEIDYVRVYQKKLTDRSP
jgi:beta-glucanase (GH16 family)